MAETLFGASLALSWQDFVRGGRTTFEDMRYAVLGALDHWGLDCPHPMILRRYFLRQRESYECGLCLSYMLYQPTSPKREGD